MELSQIPAGERVFVDANVFVYALTAHEGYGPACLQFLQRAEVNDVEAVTSTHIVAEVLHRLMTIEAQQTFGWSYSGIGKRLRSHPEHFTQLTLFPRGISYIEATTCRIEMLTLADIELASRIIQTHGFLTNDACSLAQMQRLGIAAIASFDSDFDSHLDVTRYGG